MSKLIHEELSGTVIGSAMECLNEFKARPQIGSLVEFQKREARMEARRSTTQERI
jgi:hypothetical protein